MDDQRKERAVAAVVGCFVCDAAAQPLHWIYNLDKLDRIVGSHSDSLEFWETSHNPFYCIETGRGTQYSAQTEALLTSLVACKEFNRADYARRLHAMFGPGTDYDNDLNSKYVLKSGKQKDYPIKGPWRPRVIKDFLQNYAEGLEETGNISVTDMHAVVSVVPIVALYAGRPEMLDKVADSIAVVSATEEAVAIGLAAARILEQFILNPGMDGAAAVDIVTSEQASPARQHPTDLDRAVISHLRKVVDKKGCEHREAAKNFFKNS